MRKFLFFSDYYNEKKYLNVRNIVGISFITQLNTYLLHLMLNNTTLNPIWVLRIITQLAMGYGLPTLVSTHKN